MAKTIEIPEGYEARIEGNKVIFEPKDSEDERIRKEIIDYLNFAESHNLLRVADHKKKKGWLAYLERQKEQIIIKQNIIDSIRANTQPDWDFSTIPNLHKEINRFFGEKFVLPHTEDTVITVSDVIRCAYHFYKFGRQEQQPADDKAFEELIDDWWKHEKVNNPDSYNKGDEIQFDEQGFKNFCRRVRNMYVEQKPVEWSKEDEEMLRIISNRLDKFSEWATEQGFPIDDPTMKQSPIAWFKSLPERFNLQPKLKWNEEDEWKRSELLKYLEEKGDYRSTWYSWLKSFPERFNLPPKQEWSEESRRRLGRIQMVLESWDRSHTSVAGLPSTIPDDIDWLKSLHPSWKPSKEQIKALEDAKMRMSLDGYGLCPLLQSLIDDLKSL